MEWCSFGSWTAQAMGCCFVENREPCVLSVEGKTLLIACWRHFNQSSDKSVDSMIFEEFRKRILIYARAHTNTATEAHTEKRTQSEAEYEKLEYLKLYLENVGCRRAHDTSLYLYCAIKIKQNGNFRSHGYTRTHKRANEIWLDFSINFPFIYGVLQVPVIEVQTFNILSRRELHLREDRLTV